MNALGAFYCPHTFIAVKAATAVADVGGAAVGEIRVAQQAAADLHKVKAGLHKLRERPDLIACGGCCAPSAVGLSSDREEPSK